MRLDAMSAGKGDALLLRWTHGGSEHQVLIDGGPAGTWAPVILPHLRALAGTDPVGTQLTLALDAVVVSHIDDDHIHGVLDLLQDIRNAYQQARTVPVTVGSLWHNSFASLAGAGEVSDDPALQAAVAALAARPLLAGPSAASLPGEAMAVTASSIAQGQELDVLARGTGIDVNPDFRAAGGYARAGAGVVLAGMTLTVLAPNDEALGRLARLWRARAVPAADSDSAARALAAVLDDRSVPNLSSIVLLAEFGGRRALLAGDARGDHILEAVNPLAPAGGPFHVDLFKIGHHGSRHSNSAALFEAVTADHYVISGNGEHGNPHPDTLQALFDTARGRPISVYLTNDPRTGASKPADVATARAAAQVLARAAEDTLVSIIYRDPASPAISVQL